MCRRVSSPANRHFVHHPDPAISAIAVDMLTEQYTLSSIWSSRGAYVETEEMKLKEIVPDTVLKFKSDKIKIMQKELRRAMAEAAGDDEKIADPPGAVQDDDFAPEKNILRPRRTHCIIIARSQKIFFY